MLSFFRKYQRFFFLVITVIIVISFSLFGTYNTLMKEASFQDQKAFIAVDGSKVSRSELDQMAAFIGTDSLDKMLYGGAWGPNFLNDGVVVKNFLETGLGVMLAESYSQEVASDLQSRLDKEKRFQPYAHPAAGFINADNAWGYFAPEIKANLQELRELNKAETPEALGLRTNLYLAERRFPAPMLRQVLHYQQRQYGWVAPDENLDRQDLSLFGYHTLEDWYGPRFLRLVSEFIINSGKIAEKRGYQVSKEEALADLRQNSETSFQQNQKSGYLGVKSASEYFNEQLRLMSMDQQQAVKVWRQVMLFRRLFDDEGNAIFTDTLALNAFEAYAKETVEGELYQLPESLRLANYKDLQAFEVYLNAVSKRGNDILALPTTFLTPQDVERQNPELVQRRFLVEYSQFNKKNLQAKVSIKDTWKWETEQANWEVLKKQFSELGIKNGANSDERFATLEGLDAKTRQKIDTFAREQIVDAHPEWLTEGLSQAQPQKMALAISIKGGKSPFVGLKNNEELIALLDNNTPQSKEKLNFYTADNKNYYRIQVLERDPNKQIPTFAQAKNDDILEQLVKKKLEADYVSFRDSRPSDFQKADRSWKPLDEVQDQVADHYFDKVLKAIRDQNKDTTSLINGDFYANNRLNKYVTAVREKIKNNSADAQDYLRKEDDDVQTDDKLSPLKSLADQWKLESESYKLARSDSNQREAIKSEELFALAPNEWSKVYTSLRGNITFFQLKEKKNEATGLDIAAKTEVIQRLAGNEAQRQLMTTVLNELQAKKAISLDYMNGQ